MKSKFFHWPDHNIGKRESRRIRDEHNALANEHSVMLEALKKAKYLAACINDASTMRNIGPDIEGILDTCNSVIDQVEKRETK